MSRKSHPRITCQWELTFFNSSEKANSNNANTNVNNKPLSKKGMQLANLLSLLKEKYNLQNIKVRLVEPSHKVKVHLSNRDDVTNASGIAEINKDPILLLLSFGGHLKKDDSDSVITFDLGHLHEINESLKLLPNFKDQYISPASLWK